MFKKKKNCKIGFVIFFPVKIIARGDLYITHKKDD